MSNLYRLVLSQEGSVLPCEDLRQRLRRIPGLENEDANTLTFGDEDEHGLMRIRFRPVADPADSYDGLDVEVPRPWVHARGPQVFALVFMIAEWIGWSVYDPQIESTLQKEAVLQGLVAMRQAQLEKEGKGGPPGTQAHFVTPTLRDKPDS